MSYCAKYVIGYYLTMDEWAKYLNTNNEEFGEVEEALSVYGHYINIHGEPSGDMVFGVCRATAKENRFTEIKDGESYVSMAQIREIINKMELCFPGLPYNSNRVIKEYICCQVV